MKKDDPRKIPLSDYCTSLGELMMHIAECKKLDKKDQEKHHLSKKDMEIK